MTPTLNRQIRRGIAALLLFLTAPLLIAAQAEKQGKADLPFPRSFAVSAGIGLPVGTLQDSHAAGADVQVYYSRQRLGRDAWRFARNTRFLVAGGYQYFFGKKVTVSNYPYEFPSLQVLSLGGGLVDNHIRKTQLFLSVAPALGLYDGTSRYYTTARLQAAWFPARNSGLQAGAQWMQESGARSFWSFHLQYIYCIK